MRNTSKTKNITFVIISNILSFKLAISGATKPGVPHRVKSISGFVQYSAKPKSAKTA